VRRIFRFPAVPAGLSNKLDPEPVPTDGRWQGFWGGCAAVRPPRAPRWENTLFEDSDQSNTFKAFEPTQGRGDLLDGDGQPFLEARSSGFAFSNNKALAALLHVVSCLWIGPVDAASASLAWR